MRCVPITSSTRYSASTEVWGPHIAGGSSSRIFTARGGITTGATRPPRPRAALTTAAVRGRVALPATGRAVAPPLPFLPGAEVARTVAAFATAFRPTPAVAFVGDLPRVLGFTRDAAFALAAAAALTGLLPRAAEAGVAFCPVAPRVAGFPVPLAVPVAFAFTLATGFDVEDLGDLAEAAVFGVPVFGVPVFGFPVLAAALTGLASFAGFVTSRALVRGDLLPLARGAGARAAGVLVVRSLPRVLLAFAIPLRR